MNNRERLMVLDFDGFLINSYRLLKFTFGEFGLDVGDEERFRHRRKFLKYLGGGREILKNLVHYSLPKKRKIRRVLTEVYQDQGRVYPELVPLLNRFIADPGIHVGVISRNFTHNPGLTIRAVLRNSDVDETNLDFIVPVDVGVKKHAVLQAMRASRYRQCLFGADEIGDYRAAMETGYDSIVMAGYGFDTRQRLIEKGGVPADIICDSPRELAEALESRVAGAAQLLRLPA